MALSYALALVAYWLLEYRVRLAGYPKAMEPSAPFFPSWKKGEEWTLLVSPGYWLARCLKNRIDSFPKNRVRVARRRFIAANNKHNLLATSTLAIFAFAIPLDPSSVLISTLGALATIRYLSRCFEISYAFGKDVIRRAVNRSGLSKYTRIQLAFRSYIELFVLAAPVYYVNEIAADWWHAITLSLSVGTMTNIGYAFPECHSILANLVFFQVFATLSLVLLSLASYVSREK